MKSEFQKSSKDYQEKLELAKKELNEHKDWLFDMKEKLELKELEVTAL